MLTEAFTEAFALITSANADLYEILWLSIQVSLTALFVSIALGLPIGTALAIANFPGKNVCITILNSLMGLPPVVVGLLVYLALSRSGPFGVFGLLYTPTAMVIAQVVLITPIGVDWNRMNLTGVGWNMGRRNPAMHSVCQSMRSFERTREMSIA